jgi:quercetin dioxygenase-like cupin family protein
MRQVLALVLGLVLLAGGLAVVGLGPSTLGTTAQTAATATPDVPPVVRDVLASGLPPFALGHSLDLAQYTIAPGAVLPIHVHPGMQVAWIQSGDLTYHVLKGEVPVGRVADASTSGAPTTSETVTAGQVTILHPGDWVIETPGAVHFAENPSTEPVTILAATLFEVGQPSAIEVNAKGTPTS